MQSNKKEDSYLCKYKVGYTTGTFDLFHVGHLNLLERAKQQCEYLVVGVSTDALVAEYKGRAPHYSIRGQDKNCSCLEMC